MITSLLLAAPGIYLVGAATTAGATYLAMALFGIFRGLYECNTHASLFDVIPAAARATAVAAFGMIAFVVGSTTPWIFGTLADTYGAAAGLSLGFKALAALIFAAGLLLLAIWRTVYTRDLAAAAETGEPHRSL
jgi:hypothetical protein